MSRETAAREKTPRNTFLRQMGIQMPGLHNTDAHGSYDASAKQGRNEICRCLELGRPHADKIQQPHKVKKHDQLVQPVLDGIRAQHEAQAAAKAKAEAERQASIAAAVEKNLVGDSIAIKAPESPVNG